MTKFPRQLNALQVAEILGPDCVNATADQVARAASRFFSKKGGFSYDPTRRRDVGVISRHTSLERALAEIASSGQPLGRPWNAELLKAIHNQFERRSYRCRPFKLTFRPIVDGLVLRIPCKFFIVENGEVIFNVMQLSRSEKSRLSLSQARFVLSATSHTLVRGDMASASVALCDLSKSKKKGDRDPVWHDSHEIGILGRDDLNRVLTIYMQGYAKAIEGGLLPASAYRPARGWEEDQYRLL